MNTNYFPRKPLLSVFVLVISIAFISCRKEFPPIFKDGNHGKPVVLVAGYESNGVHNIAKCWINGQEQILSDGTSDAVANSISVSSDIAYIAGIDGGLPVYWKNGVKNSLPTIAAFAQANAIAVAGNKIYIAGNDNTKAVYWLNGVETILDNVTDSGSTGNSVCVSGNDFYVAGKHGPNAVYWKNGSIVYLTHDQGVNNTSDVRVNSIAVSNNNVYVAGTIGFAGSNFPFLRFWENGVESTINTGTDDTAPFSVYGKANSVFVSGGHVYIAGIVETAKQNFPVYWKDGKETVLPFSATNAYANSIFVRGNDVYVAGYESDSFESVTVVYWKNGVEVKLTDGNHNAFASSIAVK
jgi:hypothetical protein